MAVVRRRCFNEKCRLRRNRRTVPRHRYGFFVSLSSVRLGKNKKKKKLERQNTGKTYGKLYENCGNPATCGQKKRAKNGKTAGPCNYICLIDYYYSNTFALFPYTQSETEQTSSGRVNVFTASYAHYCGRNGRRKCKRILQ